MDFARHGVSSLPRLVSRAHHVIRLATWTAAIAACEQPAGCHLKARIEVFDRYFYEHPLGCATRTAIRTP